MLSAVSALNFKPLVVLLLSAFSAGASEVVMIELPDPHIQEHLASLEVDPRSVTVRVLGRDRSQSKQIQVEIQGPIADEAVQRVVQSVLALERSFWRGEGSYSASIIGDAHYASVTVSMFCGTLCASGSTDVYAYQEGRWIHLYTAAQWVS